MQQCPYCREDVRNDATKCRYCGSALATELPGAGPPLPKVDLEANQVLFVLDRGLLYFAKFVLGIVVVVIALGTAFFGFDLNKAREDVDQMQKDVQKAQKAVQDAQASVEATKKSVVDIGAEATRLLEEVRAKADQIQQEAVQVQKFYDGVVTAPAAAPNAPGRSFTVPEIAALYHFPAEQTGIGQTIGLIELGGGYRESDLATYFASVNVPAPSVVAVSVDQGGNHPTGSANGPDGQVMGDIEVAGAVAPGARIVVYFAPNTDAGFIDAIKSAARDAGHAPTVISISWGGAESIWSAQDRTAMNAALQAAALQGITILVAAGDSGAADGIAGGAPHVDFPASSPWVLAVGGTRLVAKDNEIQSEIAWNSGAHGGATGGGVSDVFDLPPWQADANVPARHDGGKGRGLPDVAAVADPETGYAILVDGKWSVVGGTSLATPLWAGLIALLNQGLGKNVGYLNPKLYQRIGPAGVLNEITQGNNAVGTLPGYSARKGWNPVAGWGTPDGRKLLDWLRAHPD